MAEYIDRKVTENAIREIMPTISTPDGADIRDDLILAAQEMCVDVLKAVSDIPTADVVEVVHGQWINAIGNYQVAECSNCKKWFEPCPEEKPRKDFFECFCEDYKFCPNCGAKMDLEG